MERKTNDDPRQVLAILNSLGVVGVTATELKAFMKELKLYRKIKEQENQLWKEQTKAKILKKHQLLESQKANCQKSSLSQNIPVQQEKRRSRSVKTRRNCVEVVIDRKIPNSVNFNKENSIEETISSLTVSLEKCKTQSPCKNLGKTYVKQAESKENSVNTTQGEKKSQNRQSRKRTKSASEPRNKSVQMRTRSKSFIRSPQSRPDSRASTSIKKSKSDPVALYNKYKNIWDQLSLPGEESHAKLRWTVREKMLGSEPCPKPILQNKKSVKTPSVKGRR